MGGMRGAGFSALLGLSDWHKDAFASAYHVYLINRKYPHAELSLSCPRLRPIVNNGRINPRDVGERELCQILCAYRIFLSFVGITVSSRESASFRNGIAKICATKISAGVSTGIGTMLGAIAGYYGGKVETVIMRIVEIFMMIPNILLGIIFVAAFGISLTNLMLALGLSTVPHFARTARSSVMTVRGNEYVEAAKAMGVSDFKIIFTHVLPNALSAILVQATTRVASAIISAAL